MESQFQSMVVGKQGKQLFRCFLNINSGGKMLEKLLDEKVVAVIRADSIEEGMEYVDAIYLGGLKAIELTYSIPNVCELISQVSIKYPLCLLGVGSVLTEKQADDAVRAGAKYVVSAGYVDEVQKYCSKNGIIYMPGCMTVTELINSLAQGNQIAKVFPGDILGMNFIKDVKGPLPEAKMMVTGGVDVNNISQWFAVGVSLVGVGSSLTGPGKNGDFLKVSELARAFKEAVR